MPCSLAKRLKKKCTYFFSVLTSQDVNITRTTAVISLSPAVSNHEVLHNSKCICKYLLNEIALCVPKRKLKGRGMQVVIIINYINFSLVLWRLCYLVNRELDLESRITHLLRLSWRRQWHPTPVLLPGKSHGQRSLVGCSPWGR